MPTVRSGVVAKREIPLQKKLASYNPHAVALLPLSMSRLKTFLIEDSAPVRENLIGALEELAPMMDVLGSAEDESTATTWLAANQDQCDVAIVDIFLKDGSGLGVLRFARTLASPVQLIVLSNYATADIRRRCAELGAARVFDKSSEIDELVEYCSQLTS
jgi:DNA-binding NarL/FixJ family response regulator